MQEAAPVALPMLGERRERADAAANRCRILNAARQILAEQGADALTMQAVATAAGVGKGTVFHRFGDRDGLTGALVDEWMRDFQDEFLHGPPPLGPGAPPPERLEAFMVEFVARQVQHIELALAAERRAGDAVPGAYGTILIHVAHFISEIDPDLDADVLAGYLIGATAAPTLRHIQGRGATDLATLQRAVVALVRGLVATPG